MNTTPTFDGMDVTEVKDFAARAESEAQAAPRLRQPDRRQMTLEPCCLDERLAADHPARTVWAVTGRLDLSAYYAAIDARGEAPGRASTDPRLLIALWLLAATEGIGNGRKLARLCEEHDAYRWLCGGVSVNYHTLNDFRVGHEEALDGLLTRVLAMLMAHDVLKVHRISQDGTRVRASAGKASFRRRPRLEEWLAEAKAHVESLKVQGDEEPGESARRRAAHERAAAQQVTRLEAALIEMSKLEESAIQQQKRKPAKKIHPRASVTDPEARRMRMADGGFMPAYNVQIATDTVSRAIVGIQVTNHGTDHHEDEPLRRQVEGRTGGKVSEHLLDGGFVTRESIEKADAQGVAIYAPLRQTGENGAPCTHHPNDSPAMGAWRTRMTSEAGQAIYKERAATSETVNADLKTFRGLHAFGVRGLKKVRCVAIWSALAYNIMHFGDVLMS
ncbi:MAG TPA: IS1182 family transposase [Woeseiaceae bacterium]|nr:IS1182 family transposase [Woeseiaceae bacterium]